MLVISLTSWWTQGSLLVSCEMATNKSSPLLQSIHNMGGLLLTDWNWLHLIIIAFNTLYPVKFYIEGYGALYPAHWGSYFEKLIFPALEVNSFKMLTLLVALHFFKGHVTVLGNHLSMIFHHIFIIIRLLLNIFFKTFHILQKNTPNLVAKF